MSPSPEATEYIFHLRPRLQDFKDAQKWGNIVWEHSGGNTGRGGKHANCAGKKKNPYCCPLEAAVFITPHSIYSMCYKQHTDTLWYLGKNVKAVFEDQETSKEKLNSIFVLTVSLSGERVKSCLH